MKRVYWLTVLLLILPIVGRCENLPTTWTTREKANLFLWQIHEGFTHSSTNIAAYLAERWVGCSLTHKLEKPSGIKIEQKEKKLYIKLLFPKSEPQNIYCQKWMIQPYPAIPIQTKYRPTNHIYCDDPVIVAKLPKFKYSTLSINEIKRVVKIATACGYNTTIDRSGLVLTKKYFVTGLDEDGFVQAVKSTFEYCLKDIDLEDESDRYLGYFISSANSFLEKAVTDIPQWGKSEIDYNALSTDMHSIILTAIDHYQTAYGLQYLLYVKRKI